MEGKRYFSHEEKQFAIDRQEGMCGGCGKDISRDHLGANHGHHILPYSLAGETVIENLVVLCPTCHTYHDNLAICGEMYGGYDITDMEEEQMRDPYLYLQSIPKVRKNAENEKIQETLKRQKLAVGGNVFTYGK